MPIAIVPSEVSAAASQILTCRVSLTVLEFAAGATVLALKKMVLLASTLLLVTAGMAYGAIHFHASYLGNPKLKISDPVSEKKNDGKNFGGDANSMEDKLPEGVLKRIGSSRFRMSEPSWDLAVSPDGKWLASNAGLIIWNAQTGKVHLKIPQIDTYLSWNRIAKFDSESKKIFLIDNIAFRCWDAIKGKEIYSVRLRDEDNEEKYLIASQFARSKEVAVLIWDNGKFEIRSTDSGQIIRKGQHPFVQNPQVPSLVQSRSINVSISDDGEVFFLKKRLDLHDNNAKPTYLFSDSKGNLELDDCLKEITDISKSFFLPKEKKLLAIFKDEAREYKTRLAIFDLKLKTWSTDLKLDQGYDTFSLSPDGKTLALTSQRLDAFTFVDIASMKEIEKINADGRAVTMAFSPDGKYLYYCSTSDTIKILDLKNKNLHPFPRTISMGEVFKLWQRNNLLRGLPRKNRLGIWKENSIWQTEIFRPKISALQLVSK